MRRKNEIDNPIEMFDRQYERIKLTKDQKEIVFAALQINPEFWLFGVVNAFTGQANQKVISLESGRGLQKKIEWTVLLEGVQS